MPILLQNLNGLADSKFSGIKGSVAVCVGLSLHETPGLTKVQQALKKDSGDTVTEFCRVSVSVSNGESYWFSYTSGKIWRRVAAGTWDLVYTTAPAAGNAGCLGAMEFNGYLYWATQSRLHRIAVASLGNAAAWTAAAAPNWQTFAVTDSEFHPMTIQYEPAFLTLFIGDKYQVASVRSDGTFNNNALNLEISHRIKCIDTFSIDIVIGTLISTSVNEGEIFRWDCASTSVNSSFKIKEAGINCFIKDVNDVYVQAGRAGNIYFYNGSELVPFKRIPGDFTKVKYGEVYPDSKAVYRGIPVFGFSNSPEAGNSTGNPALEGVYSFGSYSRDYPKVLDLSFPLSTGTLASLEIGAVLVQGFDLLVAWKNGTSYGVDIIDHSNKYASAYFETRMLFEDARDALKTLDRVYALYNSLPASTGLTFSYSLNGAAYVDMTSVTNSKKNEIYSDLSLSEIGSLQIKVAFTVSGNDAPTMEAFGADLGSKE